VALYIFEHSLPEYGQAAWTINKGTMYDISALFEAIKSDLAQGKLGQKTEEADERVVPNAHRRVSDAVIDKALDPVKEAIAKYLVDHTTNDE